MKIRSAILCATALLLATCLAPGAIAADIGDVGFVDQADIANLPVFVSANRQLAAYKVQLDAQYNAQVKRATSDADKQRITLQFQTQLSDKQREIAGPLFARANNAVAAVSATRNLSVVVDKRIVIYGGQDITKDVEAVFSGPQAIAPPSASPPPSEIGFVDQNALDGVPKVQSANSEMSQYETTQRQIYAARLAQAKSAGDKQQIFAGLKIDRSFIKDLSDRRDCVAVLQAIVNLAHNLGIKVVAEGLETPDQVALLQTLDCDCGQGYYFSTPLPPAEAERFLNRPPLTQSA